MPKATPENSNSGVGPTLGPGLFRPFSAVACRHARLRLSNAGAFRRGLAGAGRLGARRVAAAHVKRQHPYLPSRARRGRPRICVEREAGAEPGLFTARLSPAVGGKGNESVQRGREIERYQLSPMWPCVSRRLAAAR
jgi:hypothetical protein